jgi:membrane-associated protein
VTLSPSFSGLVEAMGPWLVALLAFLETSFITGLLVPCGPVIIAAVTLAGDGVLELEWIVVAAVGGALAGDSVGFWVGRGGGDAAVRAPGRIGVLARRAEPRARKLMHLHPIYGVTGARLLSFVRTLMPALAGLSGLSYRRFLLWDIPGVALWAVVYIGIGLAADGSWSIVSGVLGTGGALVFVAFVVVAWLELRRRRRGPPRGLPARWRERRGRRRRGEEPRP